MISLTCMSCKKVLEIDDAFAGGVCRCQHCGTIQTVPTSLKRNKRPGVPAAAVTSKALYEKKPRDPNSKSGSGLESLAETTVGSSSGLSRGSLNRAPAPTQTQKKI